MLTELFLIRIANFLSAQTSGDSTDNANDSQYCLLFLLVFFVAYKIQLGN